MANMYLKTNARFKPFSYQEMVAPIVAYKEAYDKADAELNALYENAASKAFNFASQDVKEKAIYDDMMNKLKLASDSLASGDINSFKAIRDINKEYRQTMLPIQQRMTKRAELAKEQRDIQKANPYIRFDKDYSQASLDDITGSSTYNAYDLSTIYTNAAKDTSSLIAGLYRNQVGTPSKIEGTNYYSVVSGYGFTPDEWDEDMQNKESALYKYVQTAKEKATKGITDPTIKQEIELGVEETIRNNIGKFEHKTLQGSTSSKVDTDDKFKYIWKNGKPIAYNPEWIKGQQLIKGFILDEDGAVIGKVGNDYGVEDPLKDPNKGVDPYYEIDSELPTFEGRGVIVPRTKVDTKLRRQNATPSVREEVGGKHQSNLKKLSYNDVKPYLTEDEILSAIEGKDITRAKYYDFYYSDTEGKGGTVYAKLKPKEEARQILINEKTAEKRKDIKGITKIGSIYYFVGSDGKILRYPGPGAKGIALTDNEKENYKHLINSIKKDKNIAWINTRTQQHDPDPDGGNEDNPDTTNI